MIQLQFMHLMSLVYQLLLTLFVSVPLNMALCHKSSNAQEDYINQDIMRRNFRIRLIRNMAPKQHTF